MIFTAQKNVQKKLLEIKSTHWNTQLYPVLTMTKNIQKNLFGTLKLIQTDTKLLLLSLLETRCSKKFCAINYKTIQQ